ncbi:hypothetical protein BJ878DRAFT_524940 [Calycina marina]|uniref:Peptidase M20 dimerisation domain-containing protein n=1 Tax=Calycina marina TaxID=1763456 RepID=A0A9P8CBJ6_9HELO|nr:hypothetical protein BJ878DRAFT_524940 [Calycina marina]
MSYNEKEIMGYIPISNGTPPSPSPSPVHGSLTWKRAVTNTLKLAVVSTAVYTYIAWPLSDSHVYGPKVNFKSQCAQVESLFPNNTSPALDAILPTILSDEYRETSIKYLQNAVKIPTMTYDGEGPPGEDPRQDVFYEFADYLKTAFPLGHKAMSLDKVNTHGLLYTWQGSDSSLKPTLLMAHQDVVPVPESTIPTWDYPPFGGDYDGRFIWGRGSSDCKNQLIGIFESIELLLQADFKPTRTVILSFGFDEEVGGYMGAGHLAPFILEKYGKDSIAVIIDEGMGIQNLWGVLVAQPGVAEKGAIDVTITIRMPGGHSSVPPPHTSIGVLSELIQLIESDTWPTYLDPLNPYYSTLQCGAAYAPEFPKNLNKLLTRSKRDAPKLCMKKDLLAEEAAKESLFHKYLMTTSIAVDVISGGEKINALPEEVTAVVNHRVNIGDTTDLVKLKIARIAGHVAKKHNLTVHAYDGVINSSSIMLDATRTLEPAPITPSTVDTVTPWSVLSGTTRAQYGTEVVMSPGLMTGNTDTRFYWELSKNIFRYDPGYDRDGDDSIGRIHTVNERISVKAHIETVKWFVQFIRNIDEAKMA